MTSSGRWRAVGALLFAVSVVLSSPLTGTLRNGIKSTFPSGFRLLIGVSLGAAVLAACGAALVRIRAHRTWRYAALFAAVVASLLFARGFSSGNVDVDVVEDVHFVEYGVLTFLFYRVWWVRADLSSIVLPLAAVFVVAVLDEWLQWFVPNRVGEIRDVGLDVAAMACGFVFSVGVDPPAGMFPGFRAGSIVRSAGLGAAAVAVLAAFFWTIHVGYDVHDSNVGSFLSRYSAAGLEAAARSRTSVWRHTPPLVAGRFSREDQYLAEGIWHVERRNRAWTDGDIATAWRENLILEKYFTPVLDTPSYRSPKACRWPAAQRADAEHRGGGRGESYVSDANVFPIYAWR